MANAGDDNTLPNDRAFKRETPSTYKWALGTSGLVAVATTAALSVKPEVAGQALAGLILFILLMFVVVSFETGTTAIADTNPLAKNAQRQAMVLSWFATIALVLGAASIMSSILVRWPLEISFVEDTTSKKFLDSIRGYELTRSTIERVGNDSWRERAQKDNSILHDFSETDFTSQFLKLWDDKRQITIRIPTRGGMAEWSKNDRFTDCNTEYCWGEAGTATMLR